MSVLSDLTAFSTPGRERRVTVIQGDFAVNGEDGLVLTTVLGSCVAVCLYDPYAMISGMNHFLLAEPLPGHDIDPSALERYGAFAMEQLINGMIKRGATRKSMRAHIYGGASMRGAMGDIGKSNAIFARNFLDCDQIMVVREDVGDAIARRIEMRARSGQIKCSHVPVSNAMKIATFNRDINPIRDGGDVDLF
ncbi:MAG: chemotaxis protein CheD [Pseudomonadota bacterium]